VTLKRASDDLELDRVWTPNQTAEMTITTLDAPSYIGQDVYIEVVDDGSNTGFSWIAVDAFEMYDPAKASEPNPENKGLSSSSSTLTWTGGAGAVEHDIYLGTNLVDVINADTSDITGIYRETQSANSYDVNGLVEETKYYWRIDEVDSGDNISTGDIWSFTVTRPARDIYSDTWVATDAIDRTLPGYEQCGPRRQGKIPGIFYFTWHGTHGSGAGPNDNTEYIARNPFTNPLNPWADNPDFGEHQSQWWGQPEAGYFLADDEWVIRRNISMLTDAGIEVLVIDATNAFTYYDVYIKTCDIIHQMKIKGYDTPLQILFTTHSNSPQTVTKLYNEFYSQGVYSDLWFYWEGKPLMLGWPDGLSSDNPQPSVSQEVRDFFTWREAWFDGSGYEAGYNKWMWGGIHPQDYAWEHSSDKAVELSVMPATHPVNANIGKSNQNSSQPGFNEYHLTNAGTQGQGIHFEEQLQRGLELDPEFMFITGWNEWTASVWYGAVGTFLGRTIPTDGFYFVDAYNAEYNRDLEPMKYGYTDNYYYQMIDSVRRYKGLRPPRTTSNPKTIYIDGSFSDWTDVEPEFRDTVGDTFHRNHDGFGSAGPYVNTTGRNDFLDAKVAYDDSYVYFYVKTEDNITAYTDDHWMTLYINADQTHATGWEGYDYIVNREVINSTTTTLESAFNNASVSSGLEAWYKLDDASGLTAIDSSPNARNATLTNVQYWHPSFGRVQGALNFNGTDDYATANTVSPAIAGGDVTLSAWVKSDSIVTQQFVLSINTATGDNRFLIGHPAGSSNLSTYDYAGWHHSGTKVFDNQWHHLACVLDDAGDQMSVYIDGKYIFGYSTTVSISSDDLISFGQEYDPGPVPGDYFDGFMDEVRIYSIALTDKEIEILAGGVAQTDGFNFENAAISYNVSGNQMELAIPRADIDQGSGTDPVMFDFHWADNMQNGFDIIEFAISGDSAPNRRFNYRYDTTVSEIACQKVFDDGNGNNMDLDTDCDIDIDDLHLLVLDWINVYDFIDYADLAEDWLDNYLPTELASETIFEDDFEGSLANWSTPMYWAQDAAQSFSPTQSIKCPSCGNDLISTDIDTSSSNSIHISFKYLMDDGITDYDNVYLQYYNGSSYITITELSLNDQGVWLYYSDTIYNTGGDAQYFVSNFRIKIEGSGIDAGGEYVCIDDVEITATE